MEEQIKRIVKSQKVQYISFWIIPLLLVLLGEGIHNAGESYRRI